MIPFDALSLAAIADEIKVIVGAKVQGIRQPNPTTIVVELYHRGTAHQLLVCCHPEFFRVHFVTQRPRNSGEPPVFCATLRARLDGQTLESVVMKHSDRVLVLDFNGHKLIAELMGKHSNLIFIDQENRILSAAKWVREAQSSRPILPNTAYLWPPVLDASKPDLTEFTKPLVHSKYKRIGELWNPGYSLKDGAYPVSLSDQFSTWLNRDTFSLALEQAYRERIHSHEFNTAQRSLIAQLESAILAREVAIQELQEAIEMGGRAGQWQRQAELLMAYAANLPSGTTKTTLPDYDGTPLEIKLNSEQTGKENSLRLFEKAKKAKGRIGVLQDQLVRLKAIKYDLDRYLLRALESTTKTAIEECQTEIKERRLLLTQTHRTPDGKQVKPFDGQRIRELIGPKPPSPLRRKRRSERLPHPPDRQEQRLVAPRPRPHLRPRARPHQQQTRTHPPRSPRIRRQNRRPELNPKTRRLRLRRLHPQKIRPPNQRLPQRLRHLHPRKNSPRRGLTTSQH